ncbi:hypothetical protein [Mesorhizobium sp.]|uniref:hypothetical protein n=1 Tax=Mesorhizobium sp. TaxID=1871066 RepID=UPI00257A54C6|nr:hypothetical protein [Mesorhizobium sp.]
MRSLLAVEATSRHASFSADAEELNVSQSAISHAGTAAGLSWRAAHGPHTRPISLTTEGKIYMATLSNCLNQLATEGGALRRSKTRNALTISCNLAQTTGCCPG